MARSKFVLRALLYVVMAGTSLFGQAVSPFPAGEGLTSFVMTNWTDKDGLASNTVLDIVQDKNGYIWLASYDGLTRFDGRAFTLFNKAGAQGYESNSARVIRVAPDGTLWIGSNTDGVFALIGGRFNHFDTSAGLPDDSVRSIGVESHGKVWVGTTRGIATFNGTTFVPFDTGVGSTYGISNFFLEIPGVGMLTGSNLNGLWLATDSGLKSFVPQSVPAATINDNSFSAAFLDPEGTLWLGTSTGGVFAIEGAFPPGAPRVSDTTVPVFRRYEPGWLAGFSINCFFRTQSGLLYIGTDKGILTPSENGFEVFSEEQGLSNNIVSSFWEDAEGNLWVGTERGGLVKFSRGKFTTIGKREGLASDAVNAVTEDNYGSLWVGTDDGVAFYPSQSDPYAKDPERTRSVTELLGTLRGTRIRQIRSVEHELWFATYSEKGLIRFDGTKTELTTQTHGLPINRVRMSYDDGKGRLWIGTTAGLAVKDATGVTTIGTSEGLSNEFIMDVIDDGKGSVWIATDGGGVGELRNGRMRMYDTDHGLAGNVVFRILIDSRRRLWFCTSEGLSLFREGGFRSVGKQHGLPANTVFQMLEGRDGVMRVVTSAGIAEVTADALESAALGLEPELHPRILDRLDGLPGQPTANSWGFLNENSVFYVPTTEGLSVFDPSKVGRNTIPPPVRIEKAEVDGIEVSVFESGLKLAADTRRVTFSFTALSYIIPEKVKFAYMLDGYDSTWLDPGTDRQISYTNLPAGSFVFRVKAWNDDGIESNDTATLPVIRDQFWYQTPVAFGGAALILIILGFSINGIRLRALRSYQAGLQEMIDERESEIGKIRSKHDAVIRSMMPAAPARELIEEGTVQTRVIVGGTVLFADLVDFRRETERLPPARLLSELNELYRSFDEICLQHGCERVKTSGDVYLAAAGLSAPDEHHAVMACAAATDMMRYIKRKNDISEISWRARIGIASGDMIGGIAGNGICAYDIHGKIVSLARRLQESAVPMAICISEETRHLAGDKIATLPRSEYQSEEDCGWYVKYRDDLKGGSQQEVRNLFLRAKEAYDGGRFHQAAELLDDLDLSIVETELSYRVLRLTGNSFYRLGRKEQAKRAWMRTLDTGVHDKIIERNLSILSP